MFNISPDTKSTYSTIASLNLNPIANTPNGNIQIAGVCVKNDKCWSNIGGSILIVPVCLLIAKVSIGSFSKNWSNFLQKSRSIHNTDSSTTKEVIFFYLYLVIFLRFIIPTFLYLCCIWSSMLFAPYMKVVLSLKTLLYFDAELVHDANLGNELQDNWYINTNISMSRYDICYLSKYHPSAFELLEMTVGPKVILVLHFLLGRGLYLDMLLGSHFQTRILCLLKYQPGMRKVLSSSKHEP